MFRKKYRDEMRNEAFNMKPTIYDVAKEAGVSIATVSNVINNIGNMRASTREKVKAAILKLDYRPNLMASALTGKSTETLGLLVPDISNPFFQRWHERSKIMYMNAA